MNSNLPTLGTYRHFKGKLYQLLSVARHSEDLSLMVVYKALYTSPDFGPDTIWVRPLSMWSELVSVNGQKVERFQLVSAQS
jgi:hypothetical protein